MKKYQQFVVLCLAAVLSLQACGFIKVTNFENDKKLAEKTVENFHKLYNEQKYEQIFEAAHEDAKRTKSKEALGFVIARELEESGRHLSSELVYSSVKVLNEKERQVDLVYRSKFEKAERIETFLIVTTDQTGALHTFGEMSEDELKKLNSK